MTLRSYSWRTGDTDHDFQLAWVEGTVDTPYLFGREANRRPTHITGFHISTTPVTQALWARVMGANPAERPDPLGPVENVSWTQVTEAGGFLDRLNSSDIRLALAGEDRELRFRLPSESEWEYAVRGGPHWQDGFVFSGSNDPDAVAWYGPRWTRGRELGCRLVGWRLGWRIFGRRRFAMRGPTRTHAVGTKAPNQLGIYDMSGNVWEWCQDVSTNDRSLVPSDGRPYVGPGPERLLRGGCHHNWDLHCTVSWRYGIEPEAHDGCIGFRVVLAPSPPAS
jgi:formylglycine-generating enzyme